MYDFLNYIILAILIEKLTNNIITYKYYTTFRCFFQRFLVVFFCSISRNSNKFFVYLLQFKGKMRFFATKKRSALALREFSDPSKLGKSEAVDECVDLLSVSAHRAVVRGMKLVIVKVIGVEYRVNGIIKAVVDRCEYRCNA